jgi:anti-sigma factor RsiW
MAADCTFEPQIEAYHDGELPAGQRLAVERHLAAYPPCWPCSRRLAELMAMSGWFAAASQTSSVRLSQMGRHRLDRRIAAEMDRGLVRLAGALSGIAAGIMLVGSAMLLHVHATTNQASAIPQAAPPWVGVSASTETDTLAHDAGTPTAQWYLADASQPNEP